MLPSSVHEVLIVRIMEMEPKMLGGEMVRGSK